MKKGTKHLSAIVSSYGKNKHIREPIDKTIKAILDLRQSVAVTGLTIQEMKEEGRRK